MSSIVDSALFTCRLIFCNNLWRFLCSDIILFSNSCFVFLISVSNLLVVAILSLADIFFSSVVLNFLSLAIASTSSCFSFFACIICFSFSFSFSASASFLSLFIVLPVKLLTRSFTPFIIFLVAEPVFAKKLFFFVIGPDAVFAASLFSFLSASLLSFSIFLSNFSCFL